MKSDAKYDKEETSRRMKRALTAALTSAPKPREDMKIQKPKASQKKNK